MGYTHYFRFNKSNEKLYKKAIEEIQMLVYDYAQKHGGISGYTAHTKPGKYAGVKFNGSRDNGHEDFFLRETFKLNESFNFCKTARKPYDVLVVASLCILNDVLQDRITISSDGDYPDWAAGAELASLFLGRKLLVPSNINRTSKLKLIS
jgi:hypothetical protein